MNANKNKLTNTQKIGIFATIFMAVLFVFGLSKATAEILNPVRQDISYTITGDNVFGTYNVKTNGHKVFTWTVTLTHNGPGAMHPVTIGHWNKQAGTAATVTNPFAV